MMSKNQIKAYVDETAYELMVAEEELILHAQMLIQRVLNERGITQKQLAKKMGVGESYVSQMLGLSARNLTLKTIARVMHALGVKATLALDDHQMPVATPAPSSMDEQLESANDDLALPTLEEVASDPKAILSRMASAGLSAVWGDLVELNKGKVADRRRKGEAAAYSAYDPDVQEMALAA